MVLSVLLQVSNLHKSYGVDHVLNGVDFRIDRREKVALAGRNGTGKTTLLRLLTGELEHDGGQIIFAKGAKLGYLRQEPEVVPGITVWEEAEKALHATLQTKLRLQELESRLDHGLAEEDLEEYTLLHEHFLEEGGYSLERDIRVVLQRMGFTEEEFQKDNSELSGGERTRLALARLLLEEPDLLVLDEPTNHLDLQATEWLEGWIQGYRGAVLLVSHDRAFLESTAQRVLELSDGRVKSYPGDFRQYLRLREEEQQRLADLAERQEQEIAKLDEFVRRFMNSQRTAQARGRLKQMEKLIERKVEAPKQEKAMKVGFRQVARSSDSVVVAEGLCAGYPGVELIRDLDWTVRWTERWGVIGENGAGKSTLIKTILGKLEPLAGRVRMGNQVALGYFAQDVVELDPDVSPLDYLVYEGGMDVGPARNLLGRFLFSGDDVFRPVRSLSGGEKNKLVLALLTQLQPNLLVLDEPTNHLDMASRDALAEVLKDYRGTLLLVSHDRWLLSQVTERILDVRRDRVVLYPGSYAEYRASLVSPTAPRANPQAQPPSGPVMSPRELSKAIARCEAQVRETEQKVAEVERLLQECENKLSALGQDDDVLLWSSRHAELQQGLDEQIALWTAEASELDRLRSMQG